MTESLPTIPQVIGENVKRLRGDFTLEDLASYGRSIGATWSSGSVRAIERGDFKATIETIALLALALDRLTDDGTKTMRGAITSRDLLQTEGKIELGNKYATNTERLLEFLGGGTSGTVMDMDHFGTKVKSAMDQMKSLNLPSGMLVSNMEEMERHPVTPTEERLAKRIGIDVLELRNWAWHLWGTTFERQRDNLAGEGASPQKKGSVSPQLLDEIQAAMKENSGND